MAITERKAVEATGATPRLVAEVEDMHTYTVNSDALKGTLHSFDGARVDSGTISSPGRQERTLFDFQDLMESVEDRLDGELTQRAFQRACDSPRISLDQLRSEVK